MEKTINITLKVWRQKGPKEKGRFEEYKLNGVSTDSSFLEMLDLLNEQLINEGKEPVHIRPRLPRRYLRYVFALYQRTPPRARHQRYHLPIAHA